MASETRASRASGPIASACLASVAFSGTTCLASEKRSWAVASPLGWVGVGGLPARMASMLPDSHGSHPLQRAAHACAEPAGPVVLIERRVSTDGAP